MALVKFYEGTLAAYKALETKEANALYYITDSNPPLMYKGDKLYTNNFVVVTTLPETANAIQGVLYVNKTDKALYSFNGTGFDQLTAKVTNTVTQGSTDIPTAGAVQTAIQTAIEGVTGGSALIDSITAGAADAQITVHQASGSSENITVPGVLVNPTYNAETRTIVLNKSTGDPLTIALGKDMVVKSGTYNDETHNIELTLTDDSVVYVPAQDLVDVYTGGSTGTATVAVSAGNEITATVKVATAGEEEVNDLVARADGLFVDVTTKINTLHTTITGETGAAIDAAIDALLPEGTEEGDTLKDVLTGLQTDLTALEGRVGTLETQMGTANGNITDLQGRMTTAEGEIDQAQTDIDAAEAAIATLNGEEATAGSVKNTVASYLTWGTIGA